MGIFFLFEVYQTNAILIYAPAQIALAAVIHSASKWVLKDIFYRFFVYMDFRESREGEGARLKGGRKGWILNKNFSRGGGLG